MNISIPDIGELGWSLYTSAYSKFLKKMNYTVEVITTKDKEALYDFVDDVRLIKDLDPRLTVSSTGILGLDHDKTLEIFNSHEDSRLSYDLPKGFRFGGLAWGGNFMTGNQIFEPYKVKTKREPCVLIFPRYRFGVGRNLPEDYYTGLVGHLKGYNVVSMGKIPGSYKIAGVNQDLCSKDTTIQDVIDQCSSAIFAIGSQSALPKLSLLQGVPTFILGHEKERHTKTENWKDTPVGWYETNYEPDIKDAIDKTMEWVCNQT